MAFQNKPKHFLTQCTSNLWPAAKMPAAASSVAAGRAAQGGQNSEMTNVTVLECARPAERRDVALRFNTGFEKNKLSFPFPM